MPVFKALSLKQLGYSISRNESGSWIQIRSFALNEEAKWVIFVLNKDRFGQKDSAVHLAPKLPLNASKGDQSLNISAIKPK